MTRQTSHPLRDYQTSVISGIAYEIANSMREYLILDPAYQRGAVWTEDQRVALVKSWLIGLPIPAVILNDRLRTIWKGDQNDSERFAVIDGKQRIETAMSWFDDQLIVPASWFEPEWVDITTDTEDGPYVSFLGLTREGRSMVKYAWKLPRIEVQLPTLASEAELYLLVNGGGTAQTEADMANAAEVAGR